MKKIILTVLFATTVFLTGCAALDATLLKPLTNDAGEQMYEDVEASKAAGRPVIVADSERVPGKKYELQFTSKPSAQVDLLTSLASAFGGPWGSLASGVVGVLISGVYAGIRGKKRLDGEKVKTAAMTEVATFMISLAEDLKSGALDTDENGKVSVEEIKEYLRKKGKEAADPAFLARIVSVVTSTMVDSDKQKALEEIAKDA